MSKTPDDIGKSLAAEADKAIVSKIAETTLALKKETDRRIHLLSEMETEANTESKTDLPIRLTKKIIASKYKAAEKVLNNTSLSNRDTLKMVRALVEETGYDPIVHAVDLITNQYTHVIDPLLAELQIDVPELSEKSKLILYKELSSSRVKYLQMIASYMYPKRSAAADESVDHEVEVEKDKGGNKQMINLQINNYSPEGSKSMFAEVIEVTNGEE